MKTHFNFLLLTLAICLGGLFCDTWAQEATNRDVYVKMKTNKGSFVIQLFGDTPLHQENFLKLVRNHEYNNVIFHRVIKGFMIQAGGNTLHGDSVTAAKLNEKYKETIPAEIVYPTHFNQYGAVAAARTSNQVNPERRSSSFQFYIVTGEFFLDNELDKYEEKTNVTMTPEIRETYKTKGGAPHLDSEYTVFGQVVKGMKVVEKIQGVETDATDNPIKPIYIKEVSILKKYK